MRVDNIEYLRHHKGFTDLPPPTHTHIERKEKGKKQHSGMQGKRSNLEKFPSEERKQSKNHCSPVVLILIP